MNNIYKQVKLSLTKQLSNVYGYGMSQPEKLGKILVQYLDIKYTYKYLVRQKKEGKKPQQFQINDEALTQESLSYDYHQKQRVLLNILKELEEDYNYISVWLEKNGGGERIRETNSYSLKNLIYQNNNCQPGIVRKQINNYEDDEKEIKFEEVDDEDEQEDYGEEEEEDDYEEEEEERLFREGLEPDPNNLGYTKNGSSIFK